MSNSGCSSPVDMGTPLQGNANDDIIVDINDFAILAVSHIGMETPATIPLLILLTQKINTSDLGLLAVTYMEISPINVTE